MGYHGTCNLSNFIWSDRLHVSTVTASYPVHRIWQKIRKEKGNLVWNFLPKDSMGINNIWRHNEQIQAGKKYHEPKRARISHIDSMKDYIYEQNNGLLVTIYFPSREQKRISHKQFESRGLESKDWNQGEPYPTERRILWMRYGVGIPRNTAQQ